MTEFEFDFAKQVIEKTRETFAYGEYADIVKQPAVVKFTEKNGELKFESASFSYWDSIVVSNSRVVFYPEHGPSRQIAHFEFQRPKGLILCSG